MIRSHNGKQLNLTEFDWPFQSALDENNRWVKLSQCIPRDALAQGYYQGLSLKQGCPAKDARLVIGAVIIKHKLCRSDRETVAQIQENPCLQYFVGFPYYQMATPYAPALFVEIRKRMGQSVFEVIQGAALTLPRWLSYRYQMTQHVYTQQWAMSRDKRHRCDDRIVSISQPYVRLIVRCKLDRPVEFGARLSVSLSDEGLARVDRPSALGCVS